MTDEEIESGRSVTEEEREDPTHAPGTDVTQDDRSAEQTLRHRDQEPGAVKEEDTPHGLGDRTDKAPKDSAS